MQDDALHHRVAAALGPMINRPLGLAKRASLDDLSRPRVAMARASMARASIVIARIVTEHAPVILLQGDIGEDDRINTAYVRRCLARVGPRQPVQVRLDSDGGIVSEAQAIARLLAAHRGSVRCVVRRRAHSAAALILAACDYRVADRGARFLLHDMEMLADVPKRVTASWLRLRSDQMQATQDTYVDTLVAATRAGPEFWRQAMRKSQELTAYQARTVGLIHEVL